MKRGRSWFARIVEYWAAITLGPTMLLLALGLTTGPHLHGAREWLDSTPLIGTLVFQLLPFALLIPAFAVFYQLIPHTHVQWRAVLLGGLVGSFLWQLNNLVGVLYVSRVVAQSKIYGSLGWVAGAGDGALHLVADPALRRAGRLHDPKPPDLPGGAAGRECPPDRPRTHRPAPDDCGGETFSPCSPPTGNAALATNLGVPSQLTAQILQPLVEGGLRLAVAGPETAYTLARPPAKITCYDILLVLRTCAGQDVTTSADPANAAVTDAFERIQRAEHTVADHITLEALASGMVDTEA